MCSNNVLAQKKESLYNPADNAKDEIAKAVEKADKEGKHVLLQIGGNWCKWCIAFDKKVNSTRELRKAMEDNYVVYHVNYDHINKNMDVLASLGYPQRFGFPVFVILNSEGNRIHTQSSAYLEDGKGHSKEKILDFLKQWSPDALDPNKYIF